MLYSMFSIGHDLHFQLPKSVTSQLGFKVMKFHDKQHPDPQVFTKRKQKKTKKQTNKQNKKKTTKKQTNNPTTTTSKQTNKTLYQW